MNPARERIAKEIEAVMRERPHGCSSEVIAYLVDAPIQAVRAALSGMKAERRAHWVPVNWRKGLGYGRCWRLGRKPAA